MVFIKTQPEEIIDIVKPVIQRNAYLADPGVMLCSMMESQTVSIRQKAMGIIKKLRSKPPKKPRAKYLRGIRSIKPHTPQWDAFSWIDIIDWNSSSIHLPYIIECLTDEEINFTIFEPRVFPPFLLHTQSVERAVKLVSEASYQVEGEESRHGWILAVLESTHEATIGLKSHTLGSTSGLSQFLEANTKQIQYSEETIQKGKFT